MKSTRENYPECLKASDDDVFYVYSRRRLPKNNPGTAVSSIVPAMQEELAQARSRIRKLENKRRSFRKQVKYLLKKLEEERILLRRREELKISVAMDELKGKLSRERRSRQRMEILNTSLINQLDGVKLTEEQFMKKYEEERRSRELLEQVCDELVRHIGEEKAEVERLKTEYVEVRDELEEERKMLQLAEVWREERVQMKLVDAKLALETKYAQMNKLITDLENFLSSASGNLDLKELRKAELILEAAAKSINLEDIEEFSYDPPKSNDIFTILNELQECEGKVREIGDSFLTNLNRHYSFVEEEDDDNERVFDTGNQEDEQGSSYSTEGSNSYVRRIDQMSNATMTRSECNGHAGQCSPSTESRRKLTVCEEGEGKLRNGTISNADGDPPRRRGQWIAAGLSNPHISQGMKGCVEWPKVAQKNSSKTKLSEAIIQHQKSQLRRILKQKR